MELLAEN